MTYKAEKLMRLNKTRQNNAKLRRIEILGMILGGHTREEIAQTLKCSQSTINRALQDLSLSELKSMYNQYGRRFFPGVYTCDIQLFKKADFRYSKYQELRQDRDKSKMPPKVQKTSPATHEERRTGRHPYYNSGIGEMPGEFDCCGEENLLTNMVKKYAF